MNKTKLKTYAPKARKHFIAAVTARANLLGLSDNGGNLEVAVGERKGDIALIAGREWPMKVYSQREDLIKRMTNEGFNHTVEAVAYTWFNRFAALRYMEIHDYLDHGHRALSNREGGMPEILNHAAELDLPGLNKAKAIELKLAGNKDNDLYKLILVAQCNALSSAMPFLFERIDDETELLLPDNLLLTDSVIAKLVADIPEEDWQEVEIIGWLYQFYISDKKDEVIGKVVKSEDIPAATQLFTPNWIVQYLVQNSVGRLWMMANPSSTLKSQWPYYIEPAEQTPEVNAQLDALIQTRMDEDGGSLNPETITVLDPACGSGHILVVAYDVLKAIYLERGYQLRAIPRLILEKNLFGLDIDDRAAQMAGFALLMKARAEDRRLFDSQPKLNVLSLQESKGLSVDELATHLAPFKVQRATIMSLVETFEHAKTFGSLIQIPNALKTHLAVLHEALVLARQSGDMYVIADADDLLPLVQQAQMLAMQFDAVVANPPYMGSKGMNATLLAFAKGNYSDSKSDLYTMFISRSVDLARQGGLVSIITMQSWMFINAYSKFREALFERAELIQMFHTGPGLFPDLGAFNVLTTNIVLINAKFSPRLTSRFVKANQDPVIQGKLDALKNHDFYYDISVAEIKSIPDFPLIYWFSKSALSNFKKLVHLEDFCPARGGMTSGENAIFLRHWPEVEIKKIGLNFQSGDVAKNKGKKWIPYNKGGNYRKWYGNNDVVINWENNGEAVVGSSRSVIRNSDYFFKRGIVYSSFGFENIGVRFKQEGFIFDVSGSSIFPPSNVEIILAYLCSSVAFYYLSALAPTVNFQVGDLGRLPIPSLDESQSKVITDFALRNVEIAKDDYDSNEKSWDFVESPLLSIKAAGLQQAVLCFMMQYNLDRSELRFNEEAINGIFISSYGLEGEVAKEVNDRDLSLKQVVISSIVEDLVSYAIGCMMGRYSLDEPGLIYAHTGNVGFDPGRYATFPADADGIIPITDTLWFEDDAAKRICELLLAVWGADTLDENMAWLAESLGIKGSETPDETIRRYLTGSFFKNHLQTYKKRPIYWLFSSGKQCAFQALVYLHRYNEGTLARMRSEYVVPLTGKMLSRIDMLEKDVASVSSPAARTKISKEIEVLRKQHIELLAYDEKLRHYADMRIQLDLDDGVKVNYGKFGDLLAEVKAVTGGTGDD